MRKLSVAPLLILIAMFLWTRFASAAESLPTTLPAKKKVAALPPKKKKTSTRTVIVMDVSNGLPKTLPAKKKVTMDFTQPALPAAPAVVVREDVVLSAEDAELIRRRDVTEAPVLEFVGPELQQSAIEITNSSNHTLRPALPDSDSFEISGLNRTAPQAVRSAPVAPVVSAPVVSAPTVIAAPVAIAASSTETQTETASASATATATAPQSVTAEPSTSTVSATTSAPEIVGPPAPPLFDTSILEDRSTSTAIATAASTSPSTVSATETATSSPAPHAQLKEKTVLLIPSNETPRRRLFIRGGYLDAPYSKLESDLKNGATLFGVSASQVFSKTEVRLGIDFAYGLDQSISLRNTRMAMFRAEGLYNLASFADTVSFYVGAALGLADIQVTSYRSKNENGDVTVRENAKGTTFLVTPALGTRVNIARDVSFDLSAQYLVLMGGDQVNTLGGLLVEGALGFRF